MGVAGVFIETHEDPDRAPSDGPNMVPLKDFGGLMAELMAIDAVVKKKGARPKARAPSEVCRLGSRRLVHLQDRGGP